MPKFCVLIALFFLCLSCSTQATQSQQVSSPIVSSPSSFENAAWTDSFETSHVVKAAMPAPVSVSFGPRLLELKASYLEKRDVATAVNGVWREETVQRYLNLLGSSSLGGSGFVGEGELTYSPLDTLPGQSLGSEWPKMLRVGVKNRWADINFGADYKSIDRGFTSITGARTEQAHDEGQFWGERSLGLFHLRGSLGQSWEQLPDTHDIRITRMAAASLNLSRPQWGGNFISSYALVKPGMAVDPESAVLTNSIIGSYHPLGSLSLGPSFTLRQEWNRNTGIRTASPMTGFTFAYTPILKPYKLSSNTSFSRSLSADGSKDLTTVTTAAALDWKLGAFLGKNDILSFNLNYNHQRDQLLSPSSRTNFSGILQLKVTGF